ncbi:transposase [Cupriavidus pauculus]|jgi:putative transposase|uniref:Transposase n=2 Tax=Cupriavidus pauculus TaxID=82633 RepID=A0A5P2HCT6_9BURK|nr:transposase [Cupriavidus pauculus]
MYLAEAARGVPVKELCARYGFSDASFYGWRARYGTPGAPADAERRRLRELEDENARLRNLLADALLRLELLRHRTTRQRGGRHHDEREEREVGSESAD